MQTAPTKEAQSAVPVAGDTSGAKATCLRRMWTALFNPVDIAFLVFFRILFGGIILWESYRYFTYGWIGRYFVEPAVNFTYYGFSWVKPWPGRGMYIHFLVIGLAAACEMTGVLYCFAGPGLFIGFTSFFSF